MSTIVGSVAKSVRFAYRPITFSSGNPPNNSAMLIVISLGEETGSDD